MAKIILTRGLQASGKSTWAKNEVDTSMAIRLNKDTIRKELHNGVYSKANEKEVVAFERSNVSTLMGRDYPYIIVDNTHLGEDNVHVEFYRKLAKDYGYDFEIKDFEAPLWECIDRDSKRPEGERVGSKVILDTYNKYCITKNSNTPKLIQNKGLPEAYIFDIDGTLAHMSGRSPYDYSQVHTDTVDDDVADLLTDLFLFGKTIIIVSGRNSSCRKSTEKWLSDNEIQFHSLYMRGEDDTRNDAIVKKEIAETHILPFYNVRGVFDDRLRVCRMWHEIGLTLFRVGSPDADF